MPEVELAYLNQTAVYWEATGTDKYGEATISDVAVEIKCKWDLSFSSPSNAQTSTTSYDLLLVADRELILDSIVFLGRFTDIPVGSGFDDELYQVAAIDITPDIKGRSVAYDVRLNRYKGILPAYT